MLFCRFYELIYMIKAARERFSELSGCSFDKGFYSPSNKIELGEILDTLILPKKGKYSMAEKGIENTEDFRQGRRRHSAVESGINALENHGLDICRDHGIIGFKRYVALAVVARNLQNLGNIIQQERKKKPQRSNPEKQRRVA